MSASDPLCDAPLVVCVGPGGVGKTTVAASLALKAAREGKRALVLTIDPARRLASALGLEGLGDELSEIGLDHLGPPPVEGGSLQAAMFDHAVGMDRLMRRLSDDQELVGRILNNRVYRAMAGSLARSHAYLAMERLHELMAEGEYDQIILDTPPAHNALDILDAPARLAAFLDEGVVRWFAGPSGGGLRGRLFARTSAAATRLLGLVLGGEFLEETLSFFRAFYDLREGFRERAGEIGELLRAPSTRFVLVGTTERGHMADVRELAQGLAERHVELDLLVLNRAYRRVAPDPLEYQVEPVEPGDLSAKLQGLGLESTQEPALREAVHAALGQRRRHNEASMKRGEQLRQSLPGSPEVRAVWEHEGELCDLEGLDSLAPALAEPRELGKG